MQPYPYPCLGCDLVSPSKTAFRRHFKVSPACQDRHIAKILADPTDMGFPDLEPCYACGFWNHPESAFYHFSSRPQCKGRHLEVVKERTAKGWVTAMRKEVDRCVGVAAVAAVAEVAEVAELAEDAGDKINKGG